MKSRGWATDAARSLFPTMSFWSSLFPSLFDDEVAPQPAPLAPKSRATPRPIHRRSRLAADQVLLPTAPPIDPTRRTSSVGIDYVLERGKRRSIGLVITTTGLVIRAPKWTPIYEIDAVIVERREWIERAVEKQRARLRQMAEFRDGGHVLFRGHKVKIQFRQGLFDGVDLTDRHCAVTTRSGAFQPELLDAELKRVAKEELPALAHALAQAASLPLKSVALSSARTSWGTCRADGHVRLNFRLIQLAPELMRHVVAHELAHLVEFNHSPRFWAVVQSLDPKMKTHKRQIKNYSVLLEL
jgi:predicted metal-dependent hydrolase